MAVPPPRAPELRPCSVALPLDRSTSIKKVYEGAEGQARKALYREATLADRIMRLRKKGSAFYSGAFFVIRRSIETGRLYLCKAFRRARPTKPNSPKPSIARSICFLWACAAALCSKWISPRLSTSPSCAQAAPATSAIAWSPGRCTAQLSRATQP